MVKVITQDTKAQIANLERQKIALEDQLDNLSYFKSFDKKIDDVDYVSYQSFLLLVNQIYEHMKQVI